MCSTAIISIILSCYTALQLDLSLYGRAEDSRKYMCINAWVRGWVSASGSVVSRCVSMSLRLSMSRDGESFGLGLGSGLGLGLGLC